ncbi:MAG: helix-turn-helix domain-containing protein [Firmicutes bacterium]|nr:helix-turn-helix domain-containing protein [Bacillota bacterium]
MNFVTQKIDRLRSERGWTAYKLSQESDLPAPTIRQWFKTDVFPTIPALVQICAAFGITLADFFAEGDLIEATPKIKALYNAWCSLTPDEQASVEAVIKNYSISKKA